MNVCLSTMIRNPGIGVVFGGFSKSVSEFLISERASDPEGAGYFRVEGYDGRVRPLPIYPNSKFVIALCI